MTDFDEQEINVYSSINLGDIAFHLESKGIDVVKEFITAIDGMAADCDFTNELYRHVSELWIKMNEELISAGQSPVEDYQQPPVNVTLNITGASIDLNKEIAKAIRDQKKGEPWSQQL